MNKHIDMLGVKVWRKSYVKFVKALSNDLEQVTTTLSSYVKDGHLVVWISPIYRSRSGGLVI